MFEHNESISRKQEALQADCQFPLCTYCAVGDLITKGITICELTHPLRALCAHGF